MVNRCKLRVSESRNNAVTEPVEVPSIDYAEREQLHEGEARIIGESVNRLVVEAFSRLVGEAIQ